MNTSTPENRVAGPLLGLGSSEQLGPAFDAALTAYAEAVWHHRTEDMRERYVALVKAARDLVAAERERWEEALRKTWRMVDPLKPAGTPGSYARGQDSGIVAALETLRQNLGPNSSLREP